MVIDTEGLTFNFGKQTVVKSLSTDWTEEKLLIWAASLEVNSEHPLAKAILEFAQQKKYSLLPCQNFQALSGYGVIGEIEKQSVLLGNHKWTCSSAGQTC